MQNKFKLKQLIVAGGVAVFSLLAAPIISTSHVSLVSVAQAAEGTEGGHTGESGGGSGSGKGQGKKGSTHESGHGGASKSTESVLSGEETDSDKKGPSYKGGSSAAGKKGKSAYAGDVAVTGYNSAVEMGRLNVAKSPSKVIDKADKDALVTLFATPALYQLTSLDAVILAIKSGVLPGTTTPIVRIDSPLQNLGLYKDLLTDSKLVSAAGTEFSGLSNLDLLAIFIGGASDKAGAAVSPDTITNLNIIFGLTDKMSATDVATVAAGAAAVQAAILEAHSE